VLAVIPLRGFDSAKTRLAAEMSATDRARIAAAVAARVVAACRTAGWDSLVVSSAADVILWSEALKVRVVPDPGSGLDAAATAGIAIAPAGPWAVIHGDLPLITATDLDGIAAAAEGAVVLAPSRDGGTNLVAASGPFEFSYGPASFSRHLARVAARSPRVIIRVGLAVELDTPADLAAARAHPEGRWLSYFLS
jgi:2-phospho-L-lactate/phosphoenolpyruvate guanylyltransferase